MLAMIMTTVSLPAACVSAGTDDFGTCLFLMLVVSELCRK